MLSRCYSEKYQIRQPTYTGCSVSEEWKYFSNFRDWMEKQDWKDKELDKDILFPGNKIYSPGSCVFISSQLNMFMNERLAARGEFPLGVYWYKPISKFKSQCKNPFTKKNEHLGYFTDSDEAHLVWKQRKHEFACIYADMQDDPRIAQALRTRYLV